MVMHLDMNSYFATVEQQCDPFLRGKPICIAGKGKNERTVCAAASIEAKKFGVKSSTSAWEAKALCPDIILVPPDFEKYQFISRKVFAILEEYSPTIEIFSIDEAFADLSHIKTYTEAAVLAQEIKFRIRNEIGEYLKCSVGLAENKLLAKLASEMQKPDGLTIIKRHHVKDILDKTPIEELCGIGSRLQLRLNSLGIKMVGELGAYSLENLIQLFGPHSGKHLKQMGQGIDSSPIISYRDFPAEKSFGHSYTLPKDISDINEAKKVLLKLSEKVGRRMRKAGVFGKTIHVYLRFFDFTGFGKQASGAYLQNGYDIYQAALKILESNPSKRPIRLIGVSVSNLKNARQVNQVLFLDKQKEEKALNATDKINDHFGEFTIFRSSLVKIKDRIQNIPDGRNKRLM
ncbi:TPA: DNA polymerase IV [Candidatus Berkelbacteria bacterium]|uniref:DNA polymerase IV n=1 Tax=Berkelbacteria bacterium GW2011_GWE1_39_12 TaxID=1618337 RepID=A0A0G4B5G1_9BACT|nr:MAG: DNA-directed DNA polymerase, DNA polymerase IV [Berkelbacteria bacterium GW2011_GWE1_39_12]HBO60117.1 DNA polymerase IV [Candidatus Berkelbacteria bacterium]